MSLEPWEDGGISACFSILDELACPQVRRAHGRRHCLALKGMNTCTLDTRGSWSRSTTRTFMFSHVGIKLPPVASSWSRLGTRGLVRHCVSEPGCLQRDQVGMNLDVSGATRSWCLSRRWFRSATRTFVLPRVGIKLPLVA